MNVEICIGSTVVGVMSDREVMGEEAAVVCSFTFLEGGDMNSTFESEAEVGRLVFILREKGALSAGTMVGGIYSLERVGIG